jgi:uncharacterized membrane protein YphA (DoxX/SURF4 family)
VTNQPDESHPLRDRVDEAISWFTQTDEPAEPAGAPVAEERAPVAEEGTQAVKPVTDVTPDAGVPDATPDTPVAANIPGNEAASVEVPAAAEVPVAEPVAAVVPAAEPVVGEPEVATERVYQADEFISHPVAGSSEPVVVEPTDVAPERVSEADDFVPAHAAEEPAVVDAEAVVAEPVVEQVESSDVDEPTRIHPIEPPSSWAEVHPEAKHLPADEVTPDSEATAAQRSLFRDEAPTVALPAGAVAAAVPLAAVPVLERTAVLDAQEAARVRREERAARDRQLGKVIAAPDDADEPLVTKFTTPSTYKGLPSLGVLLFRLVIAAVVGIRAWQHVTHLSATRDMWAATIVPSPGIIAWTQISLEIAIAVMLVLGLGTRIAGLLLLILAIAQLAFVQWGVVSPFQPGAADFIGAVDVMLAGAGVLFASIGGGRIAFDGAIHTGHIGRKNDKLFA